MGVYQWKEAIEFCEKLEFAGYSDWRLPSIKELLSLVNYSCINPTLPCNHLSIGLQSGGYWASNSYAYCNDNAGLVYMDYGVVLYRNKSYANYVWPVRLGQFDTFDNLIIPGCDEGIPRSTDNGDGTVTDNATGLMWVKDPHNI